MRHIKSATFAYALMKNLQVNGSAGWPRVGAGATVGWDLKGVKEVVEAMGRCRV